MALHKLDSNSKQTLWTPARVVFTVIVLGIFAAFGVSSCNSSSPISSQPPSSVRVTPNQPPAPTALTSLPATVRDAVLPAAAGAPIKLADYSGKVLLVNLWATWCGPCRLETPELVRLHKEFQARGVEMIGLSTENPDASAETVRSFVKAFNVDYRVGWATRDVAITLMQGRDSIPQSFIIGRDGRIVRRFIGFRPGDTPQDTPQQLRQALEDALKG